MNPMSFELNSMIMLWKRRFFSHGLKIIMQRDITVRSNIRHGTYSGFPIFQHRNIIVINTTKITHTLCQNQQKSIQTSNLRGPTNGIILDNSNHLNTNHIRLNPQIPTIRSHAKRAPFTTLSYYIPEGLTKHKNIVPSIRHILLNTRLRGLGLWTWGR